MIPAGHGGRASISDSNGRTRRPASSVVRRGSHRERCRCCPCLFQRPAKQGSHQGHHGCVPVQVCGYCMVPCPPLACTVMRCLELPARKASTYTMGFVVPGPRWLVQCRDACSFQCSAKSHPLGTTNVASLRETTLAASF